MGLFILACVVLIALVGALFFVKKRTGNEPIWVAVGMVGVLIVAFLTCNVFPQYGESRLVDTIELSYAEQSGASYVEDDGIKLFESETNVKISYQLSFDIEESDYIFKDDENCIYFIIDDKVRIKTVKELLNNEEGVVCTVEVIEGDYEKPYVEKYNKEAPVTFWSMGGNKSIYKIYIPENMTNE